MLHADYIRNLSFAQACSALNCLQAQDYGQPCLAPSGTNNKPDKHICLSGCVISCDSMCAKLVAANSVRALTRRPDLKMLQATKVTPQSHWPLR